MDERRVSAERAADVLRWMLENCEVVSPQGLVDTSPGSACGDALLAAIKAFEWAAAAERRAQCAETELRLLERRCWVSCE